MTYVLLLGLATFAINLLVHAAIWNLFRVHKEIQALLILFVVAPSIGYLGLVLTSLVPPWPVIAAGLLHLMLACAYIQTYPALREDIPSVRILFMIHANPGIHNSDVVRHFHMEGLLDSQKVKDLGRDGLIVKSDSPSSRLVLTKSGALLAAFFYSYRKILGVHRDQG